MKYSETAKCGALSNDLNTPTSNARCNRCKPRKFVTVFFTYFLLLFCFMPLPYLNLSYGPLAFPLNWQNTRDFFFLFFFWEYTRLLTWYWLVCWYFTLQSLVAWMNIGAKSIPAFALIPQNCSGSDKANIFINVTDTCSTWISSESRPV